jgi:hypothetical protein
MTEVKTNVSWGSDASACNICRYVYYICRKGSCDRFHNALRVCDCMTVITQPNRSTPFVTCDRLFVSLFSARLPLVPPSPRSKSDTVHDVSDSNSMQHTSMVRVETAIFPPLHLHVTIPFSRHPFRIASAMGVRRKVSPKGDLSPLRVMQFSLRSYFYPCARTLPGADVISPNL